MWKHINALVVALLVAAVLSAPTAPVWPSKFTVSGSFQIPFWDLDASFSLQQDSHRQAQALSWFNGLDESIIDNQKGLFINKHPRKDRMACEITSGKNDFNQILPDLSSWTYIGEDRVEGWIAQVWQKNITSFGFEQIYTFYVHVDPTDKLPIPIQYVLQGTDISLGNGHPDIYVWIFGNWMPNVVAADAFEPEPYCKKVESELIPLYRKNAKAKHGLYLMSMVGLPVQSHTDEDEKAFHNHVLKFGKPILHGAMYAERLAAFKSNKAMIDAHNKRFARGESSYELGLNHFADLSLQERVMLYSPKANLQRRRRAPTKVLEKVSVTGNFSWVKEGAVNDVVDQAACGSCWAFGTIAALEGAQYVKNKHLPKLSEQQLVDCSWNGNEGCNGGFAAPAYEWIMSNGGIADGSEYPYLGQDTFCYADAKNPNVKVVSYVNTTGVNPTLEELKKGPMAIAIDAAAAPGDFYFYRRGVYDNPQCGNTPDDLDHEVTLVGYSSYDGKMGAVFKNSWSTHWGDEGYGMMGLENNDCGWATQARRPNVQ